MSILVVLRVEIFLTNQGGETIILSVADCKASILAQLDLYKNYPFEGFQQAVK